MDKSEEDRKNWLSRQADKPRPEPEKRDQLHNRQPDPRQGRKILSTWINPAAIRQCKTLAITNDKSQQAMMEEALNFVISQI